MSRHLDWSDPVAVSRWIHDVRTAFDDADGVIEDMLRPARARELGAALHREHYTAARQKIRRLLDFAELPEAERCDPSGNGGSPTY